MFHILGILFVVIIAILILGLSIIGTVIRRVFGLSGRRSSSTYQSGGNNSKGGYSYNKQQSQTSQGETDYGVDENHPKHKKLFAKDEGEYVDFEEVKE